MTQSPAEILRELVAIASPSAISNLPVLRWVAAFLEPLGWRVELFPYRDPAGIEKANLVAWPGSGERPTRTDLAFICHTDTVPYAAEWSGALDLTEREGHLHGCGSCDVKGALACFLAAVAGLDAGTISPGVGLILTADEEIGCKGMEQFLQEVTLRIGSAIVSEPTSLCAGISGKGYGLAQVTVEGREAHSAFPQQGVSAISMAARLISRIEDELDSGGMSDSLFDPPRTTFNIGVIQGGTAKNIVPGRCGFLVEWRSIPKEDADTFLVRLKALVAQVQARDSRAAIRVEGLRAEAGFAPAAGGALRAKLSGLLPGKPVGISFGSEASRVARIAEEVIVIGPGDMRTAHSDRERVPISELETWTEVLAKLVSD